MTAYFPRKRRVDRLAAGRLGLFAASAAALMFSSAPRASEFPTLPPGTAAIVAGTHVSCVAAKTFVTCKKSTGLTATIFQRGAVRVTRGSGTLPAKKRTVLYNNNGFAVLGTHRVGFYCHVYASSGTPTMSCSIDDPSLVHDSHGFDISDRSVVVFRYNAAGLRRDLRTIKQP